VAARGADKVAVGGVVAARDVDKDAAEAWVAEEAEVWGVAAVERPVRAESVSAPVAARRLPTRREYHVLR
jgi:hypothetical protein